jgi:hypothetical protein
VAWNLQPVVLAHEVLVRSGHDDAADVWRAAVAERTSSIAEEHLQRFKRLNRKYGMRLPSIADRIGERFVRPLVVDRLCAMIEPAMDEAPGKPESGDAPGQPLAGRGGAGRGGVLAKRVGEAGRRSGSAERVGEAGRLAGGDERGTFARLEEGIQEFTRDISGAGFDVPAWLEALEQEVDRVLSDGPEEEELPDPQLPVVQVQLTREELRRQVQALGPD